MLDYYIRHYGTGKNGSAKFVRVKVERATAAPFALVLRNGRRIECEGSIPEAELSRLIRIAESA